VRLEEKGEAPWSSVELQHRGGKTYVTGVGHGPGRKVKKKKTAQQKLGEKKNLPPTSTLGRKNQEEFRVRRAPPLRGGKWRNVQGKGEKIPAREGEPSTRDCREFGARRKRWGLGKKSIPDSKKGKTRHFYPERWNMRYGLSAHPTSEKERFQEVGVPGGGGENLPHQQKKEDLGGARGKKKGKSARKGKPLMVSGHEIFREKKHSNRGGNERGKKGTPEMTKTPTPKGGVSEREVSHVPQLSATPHYYGGKGKLRGYEREGGRPDDAS